MQEWNNSDSWRAIFAYLRCRTNVLGELTYLFKLSLPNSGSWKLFQNGYLPALRVGPVSGGIRRLLPEIVQIPPYHSSLRWDLEMCDRDWLLPHLIRGTSCRHIEDLVYVGREKWVPTVSSLFSGPASLVICESYVYTVETMWLCSRYYTLSE